MPKRNYIAMPKGIGPSVNAQQRIELSVGKLQQELETIRKHLLYIMNNTQEHRNSEDRVKRGIANKAVLASKKYNTIAAHVANILQLNDQRIAAQKANLVQEVCRTQRGSNFNWSGPGILVMSSHELAEQQQYNPRIVRYHGAPEQLRSENADRAWAARSEQQ